MREPRYKAPSAEDIVDRKFLIKDRHGNVATGIDRRELVGAVLDGDSITMQNFGKTALGVQAGGGLEQLLHPDIAELVDYTGEFERNLYLRVAVSMDPILAVVYADDPRMAGDYVRMLHNGVQGVARDGRKLNALRPEPFYWAHDTFVNMVRKNYEHFTAHPKVSDEEAVRLQQKFDEQLQLESNTWYSYYGMPMDNVPADRAAYVPWRQDMIDNHLEMTDTADWAITAALDRKPPRPDKVPKRVWNLARIAIAPVTEVMSLLTIGEMSPDIREKFGIPFSDEEQKRLDELRTIAQAFTPLFPGPMRYVPPAYEARIREHGGHKNIGDRVVYDALSFGGRALKRVAAPIRKLAA